MVNMAPHLRMRPSLILPELSTIKLHRIILKNYAFCLKYTGSEKKINGFLRQPVIKIRTFSHE
jgi:hypothetical protein